MSTPSTSRTLAARHGEHSTNLLADLDAHLAFARLSKFHRLATREEQSTQDQRLQVHQARQQTAVRPMEEPNT